MFPINSIVLQRVSDSAWQGAQFNLGFRYSSVLIWTSFFFGSTRHLVSDFGHLELIILLWSWPVFNCFGFGSFQYLYPFLGLISTQLFEFLLRVSVIVFRFVLFSSSQWSIALGFVLVPFWLLIYCIILLGSCSGVFGLLYCFGFV